MSAAAIATRQETPLRMSNPAWETNRRMVYDAANVYNCLHGLSDKDLILLGFESDDGGPVVWIQPPQDPARLFGSFISEKTGPTGSQERVASADYLRCTVCWNDN